VRLNVTNHDRDSANLRYVYPVISRRAGGVSIGVNLNTNNACNFRCVYCQVPGLVRGKAPQVDVELLRAELRAMLRDVVHGDFMERCVPEGVRRFNDVAFSGNGEPTSSPKFLEAVTVVKEVLEEFDQVGKVQIILITNGSLTDRPEVERGIQLMQAINGRVWFKLDSATRAGALAINDSKASVPARLERLERVARLCPTWIQTCLFARSGQPPDETELGAYEDVVRRLRDAGVPIQGVLLYSLARPSLQPEAPELSRLDAAWLEAFAERLRRIPLEVRVTP